MRWKRLHGYQGSDSIWKGSCKGSTGQRRWIDGIGSYYKSEPYWWRSTIAYEKHCKIINKDCTKWGDNTKRQNCRVSNR